ncbi:FbpB family small basic protein [Anaerobacillus alkaliphilus]|uniref:FbpB family small basic protein n=1 Tax=Anaerobacillus alkaliphilus TaxID=1548597 RepID=A0A4Q0VWY6_9BACI|nr:FbpB family small basic protein [Anaerobacillus alkaliphilus]RXJ02098.1 FbpB family small basic protein [Anaerobacillus alkaliphilus]
MRKTKLSLKDLVTANKEEILKDKGQIEKIEKRIEDKYSKEK